MSQAVKLFAVAMLSGAAFAAQADAAVDSAQAAVLKCHADYVKQVTAPRLAAGLGPDVPGFTATEVAHASAAACKPALDAYARKVREAKGGVASDGDIKAKVDELGEYAFDYTLDAYIKSTLKQR